MFEKKRAAAENNLNNGVNTLLDLQKSHAEEVARRFLEIEATGDLAAKILKLRAMREYIDAAAGEVKGKLNDMAANHVVRYRTTSGKLRDVFSSDLYIYTERYKRHKSEIVDLLAKQAGTSAFLHDLKAMNDNAAGTLEATVRNCDLEVISGSPYFPDAYKMHEPLRDRFAAAAAARAALGHAAHVAAEKSPEAKTPAEAEKVPDEKPRKINSYDHLKQVRPPK
ncbi:MAG: hypothetical protein KGQ70_02665 [Alphaproteobacteria bacterium]|nr:hypothetical protein [Alphaproteobacteria bacterium]